MMKRYIVAIDQGTSSSRVVLFDEPGNEVRSTSELVQSSYPRDGWVEQDATAIWEGVMRCLREVTQGIERQIAAIGITNQRETVVCWHRVTGKPLAPAIVWQCRRSAEFCDRLRAERLEGAIREKTGLVLDPYFSASKINWMLCHNDAVRAAVTNGHAVFGTIDSWLLFKLTESTERVVATEHSNASRTMLYSLSDARWDPELLARFGVGVDALPEIRPSWGRFGEVSLNGVAIPICAMLGDQQASLFGQGAISVGDAKCTFGTGAFLLMQCGRERVVPDRGILETVAWHDGSRCCYALEGSIFIAGAAIRWLKDSLGLLAESSESETLASRVPDSGGVIFVPSFTGLGAPHWNAAARAAILGVSLATERAHVVRSALEGIAHGVADLTEASCFSALAGLKIDGGMSENRLFCQILSDTTGRDVAPSIYKEMTAFGAARAAALGAGIFTTVDEAVAGFSGTGGADSQVTVSTRNTVGRDRARERWRRAVDAVGSFGVLP